MTTALSGARLSRLSVDDTLMFCCLWLSITLMKLQKPRVFEAFETLEPSVTSSFYIVALLSLDCGCL